MRSVRRHYEIDMTHGPLTKKILMFAVPLIATGILQLLYNAADIAVVGKFASEADQAAVGSTGSLINLMVNLFIGLSVGACVAVSNHYGAGDFKAANQVVHTALAIGAILGVFVATAGELLAPALIQMTGTPPDVEEKALAYLRLYFLGVPAAIVYNFGAAVLRAVGDTRRPFYYLAIAGLVNVALNLIAVIGFHMGAAGVALATTISQWVSAVLVVLCLMRSSGCVHLNLKRLRITKQSLIEIARVGLPAGLQSTVFSLSNVLIQSSINSFGTIVMAGNTVGASLDGFVNVATSALGQSALSFTAQNMGAKAYRRVGKVMANCCLIVCVLALAFGALLVTAGPLLAGGVYTDNAEVIEMAMVRLRILAISYFLCGLMDVTASTLRGMGHSLLPMLVTLVGACGLRVLWIYTAFAADRSLTTLYLSYPISWALTFAAHLLCFLAVYRRLLRQHPQAPVPAK